MAEVDLAEVAVVASSAWAPGDGTAFDDTDTFVIDVPDCERAVLHVVNTSEDSESAPSNIVVTIKAGDSPFATAAGLGDKAVPVAAGVTAIIGPFPSARFMQDDGSVNIAFSGDVGDTVQGTARVFILPKVVE